MLMFISVFLQLPDLISKSHSWNPQYSTSTLQMCTTPYRGVTPRTHIRTHSTLTWRNDELRFRVSCVSQFSVPETQNTRITAHIHPCTLDLLLTFTSGCWRKQTETADHGECAILRMPSQTKPWTNNNIWLYSLWWALHSVYTSNTRLNPFL